MVTIVSAIQQSIRIHHHQSELKQRGAYHTALQYPSRLQMTQSAPIDSGADTPAQLGASPCDAFQASQTAGGVGQKRVPTEQTALDD